MKNILTTLVFLTALISCNSQSKILEKKSEVETPQEQITTVEAEQIGEYIIGIYEDSKGNLWFGTLQHGVAMYNGKELKYFSEKDGFSNRVGSPVEDKDENLWFSSHSGIYKYDGKTFENFSKKDGLCSNLVSTLFIDNKGKLWIGTWEGISTFDGTSFENFELPIPNIKILPYQSMMNWINEITQDSKGNMWFARGGYGACKYNGKTFTHFTKADGLASNAVTDIVEDDEGNIWFSSIAIEQENPDANNRTGSAGVVKYDGKNFESFPTIEGLHDIDIYEIYKDPKGKIWIGTRSNGLYAYSENEFKNYTGNNPESGFPKSTMIILEDSKGITWIGCAGGLFRMDDEQVVNVTTSGPW